MKTGIQREIGKDKRNKRITYILVFVLLFLFFALLAVLLGNDTFDSSRNERLEKLDMWGEYSVDGKEELVAFYSLEELPRRFRTIHIEGHIYGTLDKKDIIVPIYGLRYEMKLNDKNILDFGREGTYRFSHGPGYAMWYENVRNLQDQPITKEDTFTIDVENVYYDTNADMGYRYLNKLSYGEDIVFFRMFRSNSVDEVVSIMIIMTAILAFALSIVMFHTNRRQRYAGLAFSHFSMTAGLYCMLKSSFDFMPLFVRNPTLCMYLDSFTVYFMIMSFSLYVLFNLVGRLTTKLMYGLMWTTIVLGIAAFVIQFTGKRDLFEMEYLIMVPGFVTIMIGAVCLMFDAVRYKNNHSWLLLLILAPFILALCMTMVEPEEATSFMRYGIFACAILHIIEMVRFYKENKAREEERIRIDKELTESRMNIMQSQIQPHFLYNSLSTIQILCDKNPKLAGEAVEHFSRYLRVNMDSLKKKECIPFERELEHLENYLFIEKLRFRELLKIEYDIRVKDFLCPPLTVQPLVENAVKYGVGNKEDGGTICISTYEDNFYYHILVTDDGVGFDVNSRSEDNRSHIGIENTSQRLSEMCKGTLTVESKIGVGTRISIKIPKEKKDESDNC